MWKLYLKFALIVLLFPPLVRPGSAQTTEPEDEGDDKIADILIRLGQGGFQDSRSEIGKLGGGQMLLGIRPHTLPVMVFISEEYEKSVHFGLEAGVGVRIFRGLGTYVLLKYLFARKDRAGERIIDFSEGIAMIGLSYQFQI